MTRYTTEGRLQAAIIRALRKRWPTIWIFHPVGSPYQATGVPDLLICVDGLFVGMEIKNPRPGEAPENTTARVTPRQRAQIRAINRASGTAGAVTSMEEAVALVEFALTETRRGEK